MHIHGAWGRFRAADLHGALPEVVREELQPRPPGGLALTIISKCWTSIVN